jgi:uncharacterized cupin superfamily protein
VGAIDASSPVRRLREPASPPHCPNDEFCVVLEGRVVLTSDDGTVAEYGEGDAFVVQSGWSGTWAIPMPFTKHFVTGPG